MGWVQSLATELVIAVADWGVWLSIGQGLLFGAASLVLGVFLARLTGFLEPDAPAGETLGVGLASGLLVVAAWWAAVASSGRSSFTPVAVGFAISIVVAIVGRWRSRDAAPAMPRATPDTDVAPTGRGAMFVTIIGGVAVVVALALLYGSTMTLRPRDGVQPVEFNDV